MGMQRSSIDMCNNQKFGRALITPTSSSASISSFDLHCISDAVSLSSTDNFPCIEWNDEDEAENDKLDYITNTLNECDGNEENEDTFWENQQLVKKFRRLSHSKSLKRNLYTLSGDFDDPPHTPENFPNEARNFNENKSENENSCWGQFMSIDDEIFEQNIFMPAQQNSCKDPSLKIMPPRKLYRSISRLCKMANIPIKRARTEWSFNSLKSDM